METIALTRKFIWKRNGNESIELQDPGIELLPKEVLQMHSMTHAALTNADVTGPEIIEDHQVYTFSTVVGNKG